MSRFLYVQEEPEEEDGEPQAVCCKQKPTLGTWPQVRTTPFRFTEGPESRLESTKDPTIS